jgi:hypothetical protein
VLRVRQSSGRGLAAIALFAAVLIAGCTQAGAGSSGVAGSESPSASPSSQVAEAPSAVPISARTAGPTPTPLVAPPGEYILTPTDNGATIVVSQSQTVLVLLGRSLHWQVSVTGSTILVGDPKVALVPGAQAILTANKPGRATVTAIGNPSCRTAKPACSTSPTKIVVRFIVQ